MITPRIESCFPHKLDQYPIACLCGSTRFFKEFFRTQAELAVKNIIVLSVGFFGHAQQETYTDIEMTSSMKFSLDILHKAKIQMADFIYVICPGGYIGFSTEKEIALAHFLDKPVYYSERIEEIMPEVKIDKESFNLIWDKKCNYYTCLIPSVSSGDWINIITNEKDNEFINRVIKAEVSEIQLSEEDENTFSVYLTNMVAEGFKRL